MKIGISINEVLRDFIGQLVYTYNKYEGSSEIKEGDIKHLNLLDYFKFKSIDELNRFLYLEAPLEIFGHADLVSNGLMNNFNNFLMDIKDEGEHDIEVVSKEVDKSIPSTFFFLSKTACKANKLRFVKQSKDMWDGLDMLITADPEALLNKPADKISVKVKASYNEDVNADFVIDSILDFINETTREKILNTKIITYEEN